MEVFPMIYTRTHYLDYAPDFYICPQELDSENIAKYRKYILEAMRSPNLIETERRIVVTEGDFTLLGTICELSRFVEKAENSQDLLNYIKDNKSRNIVSFIGMLVKNDEFSNGAIIDDYDTIIHNMFLQFIVDNEKWFDQKTNHFNSEAYEVGTTIFNEMAPRVKMIKRFDKTIYFSTEKFDKQAFKKEMSRISIENKRCRFCSNYYGIESVKDSMFNILTSKYIESIEKLDDTNEDEEKLGCKKKPQRNSRRKNVKGIKKKIIMMMVLSLLVILYLMVSNSRQEENELSRINMEKSSAHKVNASIEPQLRNEKAESYLQYLDACGKVIAKYKDEIDFIEKMQSKLREEKLVFLKDEIISVRKELLDAGISEETTKKWIEEIKQNFELSFAASDKVLQRFSELSMGELEKKIKESIYG